MEELVFERGLFDPRSSPNEMVSYKSPTAFAQILLLILNLLIVISCDPMNDYNDPVGSAGIDGGVCQHVNPLYVSAINVSTCKHLSFTLIYCYFKLYS